VVGLTLLCGVWWCLRQVTEVLSKLRAEKVALTATVEANAAEARRVSETLSKAAADISALQVCVCVCSDGPAL
jgi:hypothetical protein